MLAAAETMRAWTDEDLAAFLRGERELLLRASTRANQRRSMPSHNIVELAIRMRTDFENMESREKGLEYLAGLELSRADLRRLVLELDLPMTHADNMERLRNRIVESLIGYRLRSQAIRGTTRSPDTDADSV
jgi:hypothetical protein